MKTRLLRMFAVFAAFAASTVSIADPWPARTITIVAPGMAGSTSDQFARITAEGLSRELGNTVIVENRPGAGTLLAAQLVANAKPDGHTLLMGAVALAIGPHVYKEVPFDPVRQLQPVRIVARFPNVVVVKADGPVKSVSDLVALLRAHPGKFNYASGDIGISEHLAGELFRSMTGTDVVHIPFKGSAAAAMAVVRGDALVDFGNIGVVMPLVQAGKLRAIAVTSATRSSSLPGVPTVMEAGVAGYDVTSWFGLLAPAGTPPTIVRQLDEAVRRFMAKPETQARLKALGVEPADDGPEAFARVMRSEHARWGSVVRAANIVAQ